MTKEKIEAHVRKLVGKDRLIEGAIANLKGIPWKYLSGDSSGDHFLTLGGVVERWSKEWFSENSVIIGSPLTLSDYLYCLGLNQSLDCLTNLAGTDLDVTPVGTETVIRFNLKTGHPATEADWSKLGELLDIK